MKVTFWEYAHRYPPILVRLLARKPSGEALGVAEILRASRLTYSEVECISQKMDWSGVDLPTMQSFLSGCRLDFCDRKTMNRVNTYLRQPKWLHLRRHPLWATYYSPMFERLHAFATTTTTSNQPE